MSVRERRESDGAVPPGKVDALPREEMPSKGLFKSQDQGQKRQRKGLISFYFSGVPESHADRDMWKIFQRWGRVWDVYTPRRLNRQGERFGFVRFLEVRE